MVEKCAICNKTIEYHHAKSKACPAGRKTRIGYIDFGVSVFTESLPKLGWNKGDFKPGDVVRRKDGTDRHLVICIITVKDYLRRGVNASKPGVYGFGGMWYGDNPKRANSFGKIYDPQQSSWEKVGTIDTFSIERLKELV